MDEMGIMQNKGKADVEIRELEEDKPPSQPPPKSTKKSERKLRE